MKTMLDKKQVKSYLKELTNLTLEKLGNDRKEFSTTEINNALKNAKAELSEKRIKNNKRAGMCNRCVCCHIVDEAITHSSMRTVARCSAYMNRWGQFEPKLIKVFTPNSRPFDLIFPPSWCPKLNGEIRNDAYAEKDPNAQKIEKGGK